MIAPAERAEQNESELVRQAQLGDRQAFGVLVRRHRAGVVNVAYRLCGDTHMAEDAAQEAFLRAWQNMERYEPRSPFRNWIYRIASNGVLDAVRRQRETVQLDTVKLSHPGAGPETEVVKRERGDRVRSAVLALPEASRAVLVLREHEQLSYKEIADTLDIPIGTVMSRLNYARNRLRETLAGDQETS